MTATEMDMGWVRVGFQQHSQWGSQFVKYLEIEYSLLGLLCKNTYLYFLFDKM